MSLAAVYAHWLTQPHPGRVKGAVAARGVRRELSKGTEWATRTQVGWAAFQAAWAEEPSRVWAWSDLHLFHANILRYTPRTSSDIVAMNDQLLASAQACVHPQDWLLFGGDVSLGQSEPTAQWLRQCPGRKVLILGNHDVDRKKLVQWGDVWACFEAVGSTLTLPATGALPELWVTHYPMGISCVPTDVINVHGHIHHHTLPGPYLNLCVEHQGLAPLRLIDRLTENRPQ